MAGVRPVVAAAFRAHGLPLAIRADNGPRFAAPGGLSRLAVRWIKRGIRLERIDPGQPPPNGRHERMRGTSSRETSRPPAAEASARQARFDGLRDDLNR